MYIFSKDHTVNEVRCTDKKFNHVLPGLPPEDGKSWRVKLVFKGDKYGLDNCITHDSDEPMVEFYDLSYPETFGTDGQFVSRYNLGTILFEGRALSRSELMKAEERNPEYGIDLQGDVDGWEMSADCLTEVLNEMKNFYIKNQLAPSYSPKEFADFGLANAN